MKVLKPGTKRPVQPPELLDDLKRFFALVYTRCSILDAPSLEHLRWDDMSWEAVWGVRMKNRFPLISDGNDTHSLNAIIPYLNITSDFTQFRGYVEQIIATLKQHRTTPHECAT